MDLEASLRQVEEGGSVLQVATGWTGTAGMEVADKEARLRQQEETERSG